MEKPKAKVLVAEDETQVRRQFENVISDAGYDVVCAASGEEARAKLASSTFDLIVTDIQMGDAVSGISIVGRGVLDYPQTKIIIVTGMLGIADSTVGQSGFPGTHATLFKPVSAEELLSTIETVLSQ